MNYEKYKSLEFDSFFDYCNSDVLCLIKTQNIIKHIYEASNALFCYHYEDCSKEIKECAIENIKKLAEYEYKAVYHLFLIEEEDLFELNDITEIDIIKDVDVVKLKDNQNQIISFIIEETIDSDELKFVIDYYGGFDYFIGNNIVIGSDSLSTFGYFDLNYEDFIKFVKFSWNEACSN